MKRKDLEDRCIKSDTEQGIGPGDGVGMLKRKASFTKLKCHLPLGPQEGPLGGLSKARVLCHLRVLLPP